MAQVVAAAAAVVAVVAWRAACPWRILYHSRAARSQSRWPGDQGGPADPVGVPAADGDLAAADVPAAAALACPADGVPEAGLACPVADAPAEESGRPAGGGPVGAAPPAVVGGRAEDRGRPAGDVLGTPSTAGLPGSERPKTM